MGFGFNDEHITPLVGKRTKSGIPIVVVTMKVSPTTEMELRQAKKVIYVEADTDLTKSRIRIIENGSTILNTVLDGDFWKLNSFMEILQ